MGKLTKTLFFVKIVLDLIKNTKRKVSLRMN